MWTFEITFLTKCNVDFIEDLLKRKLFVSCTLFWFVCSGWTFLALTWENTGIPNYLLSLEYSESEIFFVFSKIQKYLLCRAREGLPINLCSTSSSLPDSKILPDSKSFKILQKPTSSSILCQRWTMHSLLFNTRFKYINHHPIIISSRVCGLIAEMHIRSLWNPQIGGPNHPLPNQPFNTIATPAKLSQ